MPDSQMNTLDTRRGFLRQSGLLVASAAAASALPALGQQPPTAKSAGQSEKRPPADAKDDKHDEEDEVSPAEDLMREHGVLKRILMIYESAAQRLETKPAELPPDALRKSAEIIRSFIEDYHEKLEEDFLFPRFRQAGKLVDLVDVLLAQHNAGRKLTDATLRLATDKSVKDDADRKSLVLSLRQFVRMYAPHEAREDTVLFPALRKIVTRNEYDTLGEDFEKKEHELFGAEGFERMVERVAAIEKELGIYDLAQFTPR